MDADWSVECGADDPLVVIPWKNVTGTVTYIDLRARSDIEDALKEIPEVVLYPTLAIALRLWNQASSPVYTAKCDVWMYPANLFDAEDLPDFAFAQGCYVDLIQTESDIFASFPAAEMQLRQWTEAARSIAIPDARCEWTLRRALIFPLGEVPGDEPLKGFATTLYVWGYGASTQAAAASWAKALEHLIAPVLALQ
ncbi:MAG TPA: hypothetical protein VHX63_03405 [Acidobacteriaceae bacterium]|jgi:hypothetical protein|nr:hypothetical protein [Acidobacteriaceae bacterium]